MSILEMNKVNVFIGKARILEDLSLVVNKEEFVALLGRNGSGKTTTLKTIMNLVHPSSGNIKFNGIDITGKKPFEIARLGIGYVPDDRRIFPNLTVRENLEIARRKSEERGFDIKEIYSIFPVLKSYENKLGIYLSGGQQKMLALARALMSNPHLILLDEVCEGLAPKVVSEICKTVGELKKEGVAIILSDQNARFARELCERVYVLERGVVRWEGTMNELWKNEEILKYLTV